MIRVHRRRLLEGLPIQPRDSWFATADAETSSLTQPPLEFKPEIYGHQEVRTSLLELFYNKCAYCEIPLEDCDVEHYRPKGRVKDSPHHTGYYWLAYNWDNLYPACPKCNREFRERGIYGDSRLGKTMGKADAFPLLDESTRAYSGDVSAESRALLDPAQDDPSLHLDYNIAGEVFDRGGSLTGQASIRTYAINRRPLVKLRREHLGQLKRKLLALTSEQDRLALLRDSQHEDQKFAGFIRAIASSLSLESLLGGP